MTLAHDLRHLRTEIDSSTDLVEAGELYLTARQAWYRAYDTDTITAGDRALWVETMLAHERASKRMPVTYEPLVSFGG